MGGEKTRGADARKVRRLLKPARLDRRLSLTPPISVDSLSSADTHKAIGLNAHCLTRQNRRNWKRFAERKADISSTNPQKTLLHERKQEGSLVPVNPMT